jgi:hypothetical protein
MGACTEAGVHSAARDALMIMHETKGTKIDETDSRQAGSDCVGLPGQGGRFLLLPQHLAISEHTHSSQLWNQVYTD